MAIKILKQGRLPEEVTYKFSCGHCKTEFTAQVKDGKLCYDQRNGNWVEVACPVCAWKCISCNEVKESVYTGFPVYPPGVRGTTWPSDGWNDYTMETRVVGTGGHPAPDRYALPPIEGGLT